MHLSIGYQRLTGDSDIASSDSFMKYFKSGEHHFSACQIMISEASSLLSLELSRTKLLFSKSFSTETCGHRVNPMPLFRQARMPRILENVRILGLIFFSSSDRPNALG